MSFGPAQSWENLHLVPQPSDLALNPPESYLYIQDGLIIACGVLYALCYLFYMIRTYRDRTCAGFIEFTCGTMAYEIFYALIIPTSLPIFLCFIIWFMLDFTFASLTIWCTYPPNSRMPVVKRMIFGTIFCLGLLQILTQIWPDEKQQITAYWTGLALQFPIGWGSLGLLVVKKSTKGHSLEIWLTRFLGCFAAYGVFIWRYVNVPQNWGYVGSWWSFWVIVLTLLPETVYPFVYIWVHHRANKVKLG